jgi:predicted acyltransferase
MFIAGTALALSLNKQFKTGVSWNSAFIKTLKRCGWLFFWGVLDYAVRKNGLSFELWDVLTQLSFTTMVAFLIFNWNWKSQAAFSIGLLVLTEVLYRWVNVEGFDQPFTDQHNFGNFMDLILMNKINSGGWVAINCIPTAAHTIWGSMAGKFLIENSNQTERVKQFVWIGIILLIAGFLLDFTITPIIKRIATSSFVLASGGYCFLGLAFLYWWIDLKNHKTGWDFFTIVGMNSIFIYLFFEIVGGRWFNGYVGALTGGLMSLVRFPESFQMMVTPLCIFSLEWSLCFFLYRKKIFFKL